jgi:hypothetical protein
VYDAKCASCYLELLLRGGKYENPGKNQFGGIFFPQSYCVMGVRWTKIRVTVNLLKNNGSRSLEVLHLSYVRLLSFEPGPNPARFRTLPVLPVPGPGRHTPVPCSSDTHTHAEGCRWYLYSQTSWTHHVEHVHNRVSVLVTSWSREVKSIVWVASTFCKFHWLKSVILLLNSFTSWREMRSACRIAINYAEFWRHPCAKLFSHAFTFVSKLSIEAVLSVAVT